MSTMRREAYDAFRVAGVSDNEAAAAAEPLEASRDEGRLRHVEEELLRLDGRVILLTWMVGFNLALTAGVPARLLFVH
jgi:hypothetical protein